MADPTTAPHPRIVVVTAPSGAGKTTIARRVMEALPELRFSVSVTTRERRDYERDGIDYHFVTEDAFRRHLSAGDLLEYEEVYPGQYYGTLKDEVGKATRERPVMLDIDVRGAHTVKKTFGDDALVLFISPPSEAVLEERLLGRGTESDETLRIRLERARMELAQAGLFDAVVVNDDLEEAVAETLARVRSFLAG